MQKIYSADASVDGQNQRSHITFQPSEIDGEVSSALKRWASLQQTRALINREDRMSAFGNKADIRRAMSATH
jgi:hypothetical protein